MVHHQFEAGMTLGDAFVNGRVDGQHGAAPEIVIVIGRAVGNVKPGTASGKKRFYMVTADFVAVGTAAKPACVSGNSAHICDCSRFFGFGRVSVPTLWRCR
jgi:hypothetical protein